MGNLIVNILSQKTMEAHIENAKNFIKCRQSNDYDGALASCSDNITLFHNGNEIASGKEAAKNAWIEFDKKLEASPEKPDFGLPEKTDTGFIAKATFQGKECSMSVDFVDGKVAKVSLNGAC